MEEAAPEAPVIKRRRRRRTVIDHPAQTSALVASLLKARAGAGATQSELLSVIEWARAIHTEADALKQLAARPRLRKAEAPTDRLARFELNKALLDSVLSGTIAVNVNEEGAIVFVGGTADA